MSDEPISPQTLIDEAAKTLDQPVEVAAPEVSAPTQEQSSPSPEPIPQPETSEQPKEVTPSPVEDFTVSTLPPTPESVIIPAKGTKPEPPPPQETPKKKKGKGMLLAVLLFLVLTLPVAVYYGAQQYQQITEGRSQAGTTTKYACMTNAKCLIAGGDLGCSLQCQSPLVCCQYSVVTTPKPAATFTPKPAATSTPKPGTTTTGCAKVGEKPTSTIKCCSGLVVKNNYCSVYGTKCPNGANAPDGDVCLCPTPPSTCSNNISKPTGCTDGVQTGCTVPTTNCAGYKTCINGTFESTCHDDPKDGCPWDDVVATITPKADPINYCDGKALGTKKCCIQNGQGGSQTCVINQKTGNLIWSSPCSPDTSCPGLNTPDGGGFVTTSTPTKKPPVNTSTPVVTSTNTPAPGVCDASCDSDSNCISELSCLTVNGVKRCRASDCPNESTCGCPAATATPVPATPTTAYAYVAPTKPSFIENVVVMPTATPTEQPTPKIPVSGVVDIKAIAAVAGSILLLILGLAF